MKNLTKVRCVVSREVASYCDDTLNFRDCTPLNEGIGLRLMSTPISTVNSSRIKHSFQFDGALCVRWLL